MAGREAGAVTPTASAAGYLRRRGLATDSERLVLAPGGSVLLLAVLAAVGPGGVVLTRPCADWYLPPVRMLDRPVVPVPVPAECGGAPDPFALLEAVHRARGRGADPRVLLLSVVDEPTGTAVPPELLHEVCEAADSQGLLVISDESWRDTRFDPHDTVTVSPAEMLEASGQLRGQGGAVVLVDLAATLLPDGPRAAIARFPQSEYGRELARGVSRVLLDLGVGLAEGARSTVSVALDEPEALRAERRSRALEHRAYAAELHRALVGAGAVCRPPRAGRGLYADVAQLGPGLRARGVGGSAALEAELVRAAGPWVRGGHWYGECEDALRVHVATAMLAPSVPSRDPGPFVPDAGASRRLAGLVGALTGNAGKGQ